MNTLALCGIKSQAVYKSLMFNSLPPAGHKIHVADICRAAFQNPKEGLALKDLFFESPHFLVSSGTAALALSLKAIGHSSLKRQVILPAYTCPSLLAAVVKAGLEPVLCDMQPNSFQIDTRKLSSLIKEKTLCVIAVHLFGLPENIPEIRKILESNQVILIEDAAQAFGNSFPSSMTPDPETPHPCLLGSMGDIGILSFGRGKPLSALDGGAILVNNADLYEHVKTEYEPIDGSDAFLSSVAYLTKIMLYSIFFRPSLYWMPAKMPGLKIGETHFSLDFSVEKINHYTINMGNILMRRFQEIREVHLNLANIYRESLSGFKDDFAYIPEQTYEDDRIALLRFPIIFKEKETRNRILERLKNEGLGATGMYPASLNKIEGTTPYLLSDDVFPAAQSIAERILTLPLHEHVSADHIERITRVFSDILENH
jgi:perosamine synthetase